VFSFLFADGMKKKPQNQDSVKEKLNFE
jgi:hypothetical protein